MKNFLSILILFLSFQLSFTQITTAENWTKTDCEGTDHTLFTELDAGNVVIMELVMLDGCVPCINAAHLMQPVIDQYNANFENRVKWYTMGYNDTYSCDALIGWKADNEINCAAQFEEGADQIEYYGGMGMPTIVIVGRNTHTVYYNHFGFIPADTVDFADAIEYALGIAEPVSIPENQIPELNIFPNPSGDHIKISGISETYNAIEIYNTSGSIVFSSQSENTDINIRDFAPGLYFVKISSPDTLYTGTFLKN